MFNKVDTWFDIVSVENKIFEYWNDKDIFNKLRKKNEGKKPWSFLDGPITANNKMGIHHAWGRSLKDLFQRYYAMNGRDLRYQNGFDCQGLWVEVEVEKELGFKTKKDIEEYGIGNFVNKCKGRVNHFSEMITEQSKRLGFWMDWDNSYFTMSDENNYTIWSFLKKCYERGLVYKGKDVMPWCPRCGTGISQHEMQEGYEDVKHLSVFVKFPIVNKENESFLVWTTTPWTLSSNVAIAVHPELDYVKIKQDGHFYYIIKSRVSSVIKKDPAYEIVENLKGQDIIDRDLQYIGPFDEIDAQKESKNFHKPIPWKDITEEEGTGIVHIAPGCGSEDFALGKEFDLPSICPIDESGLIVEGFGWLTGKHASSVADDVKRYLKEKNILYSSEKYLHSYPHCWRCHDELLFRLVDEWYISMDSWRDDIKEIVKQINWIPSYGKELELDWLTNMHDWMISKKRYWGLALPIWECTSCNHFDVIGSQDELKDRTIEGWQEFEGNSPHRPWIDEIIIECSKCHSKMNRITSVGNPWLDAGIVPYSTVHYNSNKEYWEKWFPADLVLECFPGQFRNWFYSLLAMSTIMENKKPFKNLVGHALVRDKSGNEMHKSRGNAIWFDDAVNQVGADLIRWQYFMHDLTTNLNFDFDVIKQVRGKYFNTLWNSYAFLINYSCLNDYKPAEKHSDIEERSYFDKWILSKLNKLVLEVRNLIEEFSIRQVTKSVTEFVEELSNWYIRHNRRRFWNPRDDSNSKFAYETLFECIETLILLIAPMTPFIAEEIYQNLVRSYKKESPESIHLCDYPQSNQKLIDDALMKEMSVAIDVTSAGLAARQQSKIKTRQPLSSLSISFTRSDDAEVIKNFVKLLQDELNVKEVKILESELDSPLTYNLKPAFKVLGSQFGSQVKAIVTQINADAETILQSILNKAESVVVQVDNEEINLTIDCFILDEVQPENQSVIKFNSGWLSLDTIITDELKQEGLMREILRHVQVLRKEVGLEANDRIDLNYYCENEELVNVITKYSDYLSQELLCLSLKSSNNTIEGKTIKIYKNEIIISVKKSS